MSEARKIEEMLELEEADNADFEKMSEVAVLDDASADMIVQQLKQAEDQYDRMSGWYKAQIQKLKDIRDRTRIWAETCLRPYFEMVPTTGKKIRSYEMPGGTLKLSAQDPEYEVNDAELVPWLEKNYPDAGLVIVKKEAKWGDLKNLLKDPKTKQISTIGADDGTTLRIVTADGEIVPGVTVMPREDKFTIKCK